MALVAIVLRMGGHWRNMVDVQACELKELMRSGHSWLPRLPRKEPKGHRRLCPRAFKVRKGAFPGPPRGSR
jgi:hypothetical protein